MKYYENEKKNKKISPNGISAIVACCLIALGGASWFAVAKMTSGKENKNNSGSISPGSSYNDITSSKPDKTQSDTSSADVKADKNDVPYSPEESTVKTEEKQSFSLPISGDIIKGYSETALQYSKTYGDMRLHSGIDIKCEKNAQIKSSSQGTVCDIREDSSLGKTVVIDHGNGIKILYCGLESINCKVGSTVGSGDIIGTAGSVPSECSDGVHIHIAATVDGKPVSPLKAMGME